MSEYKVMYQRAEYLFGNPIETLQVTRQSEKSYWVLEQGFRATRESRRLKASSPPLRETWEEAKQDWVEFCARKLESKERAYRKARADLDAAKALKEPGTQS